MVCANKNVMFCFKRSVYTFSDIMWELEMYFGRWDIA